jgi:2-keto-4-pentenoate hydratase/2-oxohepta-3-ene-1,7-dioic acid hydratase in catechol pathway
MMTTLTFELPDGSTESVTVTTLLNAGYAGRDQAEVASHIAELAELGVPAPTTIPAMYPISPYLAQQTSEVHVQHGHTSGEAEWALVITGPTRDDVLLTVACDHTDRDLEVHSVAWSKNASPDVLGTGAWRLAEVADRLDDITLRAWVGDDETLIQDGTLGDLLSPDHWLDVLTERGLFRAGTVLMSGTVSMVPGVDQFANSWKVELRDPATDRSLTCAYRTVAMPSPIG